MGPCRVIPVPSVSTRPTGRRACRAQQVRLPPRPAVLRAPCAPTAPPHPLLGKPRAVRALRVVSVLPQVHCSVRCAPAANTHWPGTMVLVRQRAFPAQWALLIRCRVNLAVHCVLRGRLPTRQHSPRVHRVHPVRLPPPLAKLHARCVTLARLRGHRVPKIVCPVPWGSMRVSRG